MITSFAAWLSERDRRLDVISKVLDDFSNILAAFVATVAAMQKSTKVFPNSEKQLPDSTQADRYKLAQSVGNFSIAPRVFRHPEILACHDRGQKHRRKDAINDHLPTRLWCTEYPNSGHLLH